MKDFTKMFLAMTAWLLFAWRGLPAFVRMLFG